MATICIKFAESLREKKEGGDRGAERRQGERCREEKERSEECEVRVESKIQENRRGEREETKAKENGRGAKIS